MENETLSIPGAKLYENIINEQLASKLFDRIDSLEWSNVLSRAVQHYWHVYEYGTKNTLSKAPPPPKFLRCITELLHRHDYLSVIPNQMIINKYEPGQGISGHIDNVKLFGDEVATLSLGSDIVMTFTKGSKTVHVHLPVGSLLVMNGEARYEWKHEIAKRKTDTVNGKKIVRKTRISITWRSTK